jgi:outer membrane protein OmpA-like peptidoglycan-associated protein
MKSYVTAAMAILLFGTTSFYAQEEIQTTEQEQVQSDQQEEPQLTAKDSMVVSSWMVGLGWNFVNDSGDRLNNFTKIKDYWNGVAFPSRINIGRYFRSGIGLEAIASYNNYKKGNIIDGVVNPEDKDYFGFDTRISYDLNKLVGQTGFFDPYVGVGAGYTYANDLGRGTYNAVIGFRTWFSDRWGLDFSSSGKWSFGNKASNHVQHAVGAVYQFNIEKGLTKKGLEKLALIEAMEKEMQRVSDSIEEAKAAEAAAVALAERLAREKEEAQIAAQKRAEEEANDLRKQKMDELANLNKVYFRFDSSYLVSSDHAKLDELVAFMNKYPDVVIEVKGNADARGEAKYNQWLSQRRADSTVKYVVASGISSERIYGKGYGETQISNGCTDGVRCTSEEHRINRITDYVMVEEVKQNAISLNK